MNERREMKRDGDKHPSKQASERVVFVGCFVKLELWKKSAMRAASRVPKSFNVRCRCFF